MVLQSEWCGWIQPSLEGWPVDKSWSGTGDSGTSARLFVGAHNHRSLSPSPRCTLVVHNVDVVYRFAVHLLPALCVCVCDNCVNSV